MSVNFIQTSWFWSSSFSFYTDLCIRSLLSICFSSILCTWPSQRIPLIFTVGINLAVYTIYIIQSIICFSKCPNPILGHRSCSVDTFFWITYRFCSFLWDSVQHSALCIIIGLIEVLYMTSFVLEIEWNFVFHMWWGLLDQLTDRTWLCGLCCMELHWNLIHYQYEVLCIHCRRWIISNGTKRLLVAVPISSCRHVWPCSLFAEKREESRIVVRLVSRIMCCSIAFCRCAKLRYYNCVVDDAAEAIRRWFLTVESRVQFRWTLYADEMTQEQFFFLHILP